MEGVQPGTATFRRINLAFFVAGFVTFVTLYDVQPLLPVFVREFRIQAAVGSLPLSVTTASLALGMLVVGTLSESLGRKPIIIISLLLTSTLAISTAFTPGFPALIVLRLIQGIVLAGLPAVAMAYLGEEISSSSLGRAMGLYIAGNAAGGMSGRIFTSALADFFPWRSVIGIIGVVCLLLSLYVVRRLPSSTRFERRPFSIKQLFATLIGQLRDPGLRALYGISFLAMGSFVTLFNYITFRLLAPPYDWSQALVSWIFLAYLLGSFSSALAGRMAARFTRMRVLMMALATMLAGALLTIESHLVLIIAGVALLTVGFFGTHSVASSWVAARATRARGQASALYLFFYYLGSSTCGTAGGLFWVRFGWIGVAGFIASLVVVAFAVSVVLSRVRPVERAITSE